MEQLKLIMIILHKGKDSDGSVYIGYVLKENNDFYIIDAHGIKVKVLAHSILPVFSRDVSAEYVNAIENSIEKCYLFRNYPAIFSGALQIRLKNANILYINDLAFLSDEDILKIQGINEAKLRKIRKLIKSLGIEPYLDENKIANKTILHGKIFNFIEEKGYGFIKGADNNTYFFHVSNIKVAEPVINGQFVEFIPDKNKKGLIATNINIIYI